MEQLPVNAEVLLDQLVSVAAAAGISPDKLAARLSTRTINVPTVSEYLATVQAATAAGAKGTYGPYWSRFVGCFGSRPVDQISVSELKAFAHEVQRGAKKRANGRGGVAARENCVAALRAFYKVALDDDLVAANPADRVPKPKRPESRRRALTDAELESLDATTRSAGDDPELDVLLLRFHLETGARRGGAIALTLADLDYDRQCVCLHEKGNTERWQPVSRTLLEGLEAHAYSRGAREPSDAVLRYRPRKSREVGAALTRRRYNTLASRWQKSLPWAATAGISIHWIRHTAITTVERLAGYGVARAFAGHRDGGEVTTSYIRAGVREVAAVVELMTGESHPLAREEGEGCEAGSLTDPETSAR
jgi:integrase